MVKDLVLSIILLLLLAPISWGETPEGTLSILVENDRFTGSDRHYTNGFMMSYLSGKDAVPRWLRPFAELLPGIPQGAALRTGYTLGHSIFTPDDIDSFAPLSDQRPYAGWLYGGVALVAESADQLDTWELDLGIVGPSARAEQVQNSFHRLMGIEEANGWDNQLDDELAFALLYERKWRNRWEPFEIGGYGVALSPHIGGSLGTVATYLNLGVTLRVGKNLTDDFGAPRIRPSLPGSNFFLPKEQFGWYLFAGVDGRAVAHNIFLDGNTYKDSLSVDKKTFVGDLQAGLVMTLGRVRLAYTYVYRTPEFDQQKDPDKFGSLSFSIKF